MKLTLAPTPFELWAKERQLDIAPAVSPDSTRVYADLQTQTAFDAWNAGASQSTALLTELAEEIKEQHQNTAAEMRESRSFGTNCPGFNQDMGAHDAYQTLMDGDLWQRVLLVIGDDT